MILELLWSALPAALLLAAAALALALAVRIASPVVEIARTRAVGGRARDHAVQLRLLPASSHPDAAGHARPRAPGF